MVPGVTAGASYFSLEKQMRTRRLNTENCSALSTKRQDGSGRCEHELVVPGQTTVTGRNQNP